MYNLVKSLSGVPSFVLCSFFYYCMRLSCSVLCGDRFLKIFFALIDFHDLSEIFWAFFVRIFMLAHFFH